MSLYDKIEKIYIEAVRIGKIPDRLYLTSEALDILVKDRSLSCIFEKNNNDIWGGLILGMKIIRSNELIAIGINNSIISIVESRKDFSHKLA